MSSSPESPHLDNRHRNTLRQIFQHPTSHNIEWRAVMSLLETLGVVDIRHDGKVAITVGSETKVLDPPIGKKDADAAMVVELRRLLSLAGYGPA
jgi:hypothetical protein